jgi:hypothetical protein
MFTRLDQKQYQILSYPIVTTVETKSDNFVEGWAQCIAQMLACQKLNTNPNVIILGIITTGKLWEFAKLEGNIVAIHNVSYAIYWRFAKTNHGFGLFAWRSKKNNFKNNRILKNLPLWRLRIIKT